MTPDNIYDTLARASAASRDKTMLSVAIDRIIELNERVNELELKLYVVTGDPDGEEETVELSDAG